MTRTGPAVSAWAKSIHSWHPPGYCLVFVHDAFAVGAYYGSARLAWEMAAHRHPVSHGSSVPANVPVFWTGGSHGYGHIAVSLGGGLCRSTDWPSSGLVSTARIDDISARWGEHLAGWTEDLNRVRVYHPPAPPNPAPNVIDLSNVRNAVRLEGSITNGVVLKKAVAAEVGAGTMDLRSPILGSGFRKAYALVQRKYLSSLGIAHPPAADVDGIPGSASLHWLAKRHHLVVKD